MKKEIFKKIISFVAILLIIVHIIWPHLAIDYVTLVLIFIAIIPWLESLFRVVEFPGGWKFEYKDLEKVEKEIGNAGLMAKPEKDKLIFSQISFEENPNLVLAILRIEIEKKVRLIAKKHSIMEDPSMRKLFYFLQDANIITSVERSALEDLTCILNKAIHGMDVNKKAADWAIDIGPRILAALDKKV